MCKNRVWFTVNYLYVFNNTCCVVSSIRMSSTRSSSRPSTSYIFLFTIIRWVDICISLVSIFRGVMARAYLRAGCIIRTTSFYHRDDLRRLTVVCIHQFGLNSSYLMLKTRFLGKREHLLVSYGKRWIKQIDIKWDIKSNEVPCQYYWYDDQH